jgi:murein L,D-transpeptidase YafK
MKKPFPLFAFSLVLLCASTVAAQLPSSTRSQEAITRVRSQLDSQLRAKNLTYGSAIFVRILKEPNELEVWVEKEDIFEYFKTYNICTYGAAGLGPKVKEGDGKAPEGFYTVTPYKMNPLSSFHLSFNLGYPNEYDRVHKRTGSALMVHGDCISIGCYAMTDTGIEEIYALADAALRRGQQASQVHIFPFRMTLENMEKHSQSTWINFWRNLKEGYDYFERTHIPPSVKVRNQRYAFE